MLDIKNKKWNPATVRTYDSGGSCSIRPESVEWTVVSYPHDYGFEITIPITLEVANEFIKSYVGEEVWNKIDEYRAELPEGLRGAFWVGTDVGMCNKYAFIVRRADLNSRMIGVYRHDFKFWMIHKEMNRG